MKLSIFGLISFLVSTSLACGQQLELQTAGLLAAKTVNCAFGPGASANWIEGAPAMELAQFSTTGQFVIRSIDIRNRSAIYNDKVGEEAVVVVATPFALHFLERTNSGSLITTTVFSGVKGGRHVAVQSRHSVSAGQPLPTQFHGLCDIVN